MLRHTCDETAVAVKVCISGLQLHSCSSGNNSYRQRIGNNHHYRSFHNTTTDIRMKSHFILTVTHADVACTHLRQQFIFIFI